MKEIVTEPQSATPDPLARARLRTGLFALLMVLWSLLMFVLLRPYPIDHDFPSQIDSPVLALELPSDAHDLETVLRSADPKITARTQQVLSINNCLDLVLIPLYAAFLWFFVDMLTGAPGSRTLCRICHATILGAVLFDYLEDFGIFRALRGAQLTDEIAHAISLPSHVKWGFFGSALFFVGMLLFRSDGLIYSKATTRIQAILFTVAGLLVLSGLMEPAKIELGANVFGLCAVWNAGAWLGPTLIQRFPGIRPRYVTDFCNRERSEHATSVTVEPATMADQQGDSPS
jgi:hypothetical protein